MPSKEYMNAYMKRRWKGRRDRAVKQLGGFCKKCCSTEKLQFDHIDPATKACTIAKAASFSEVRFQTELDKCQLLCIKCHETKTLVELNRSSAKGIHGTVSSYRYCKCALCKQAKREYMQRYRKS